jgi:hypothetical protein
MSSVLPLTEKLWFSKGTGLRSLRENLPVQGLVPQGRLRVSLVQMSGGSPRIYAGQGAPYRSVKESRL